MKHTVAVLILLLLMAAGETAIGHAQANAARRQRTTKALAIPENIGQFRQAGTDEEVDAHTKAVLETSTILIRNYVSYDGLPVELTIVYAGSTRRSLHFPEVCLVGAGWEIREQYTMNVGFLFDAKRLVLVSGNKHEAVLYWFKTGDKMTGNYFLNAFHWAKNQITSAGKTSAMIKLTTRFRPGSEDGAFAVLERFAMQLAPVLEERVF